MPLIRWRLRRILKVVLTASASLLLLGCIHVVRDKVKEMKCSHADSIKIVENLCHLYQSGAIAGNMCVDICDYQTIQFKHCLNSRDAKKVLVSDWSGQTVILKTKKAHISDYDLLLASEGAQDLKIPSEEEFESLVRNNVKLNLGIPISEKEDTLTKLWSSNFHSFLKSGSYPSSHKAAMNSLWSLIQQDEYLIMKTQQNSKYFPRIYGTCGHIYVIEYLPPGDILSQGFPFNKHATTWKERATVALALLNLVSSFENDFSEPLHLCDMKGENFGLSADQKVVKAIDTDMSFFNTKLGSEFVATGNCSAHSNCDFFDCKGWCVLPKNMCLGKRINNNLQAVCEKIFTSRIDNGWQGILQSPPHHVEAELHTLLRECANPGNVHNEMRYKAPIHLLHRLTAVLNKSLQ